jgi:hypothetical protein
MSDDRTFSIASGAGTAMVREQEALMSMAKKPLRVQYHVNVSRRTLLWPQDI